MIEIPTDTYYIEKIYEVSYVECFNEDIKPVLKEIIKELYYYNQGLAFKLRLNHIDRAIYKYKQANKNTCIRNPRQYFKACLISAIKESYLDSLGLYEIDETED